MRKVSRFLKKERLYILILIFVLIFNLIIAMSREQKAGAKPSKTIQTALAGDREAKKDDIEKLMQKNQGLFLLFGLVSLLILAVMLLGFVIDIIVVPMIFMGRLDICTLHLPRARWNMWDVCKVAILFFFFGYIIIISEASLSRIFHIFKTDNIRMMINSSILDTLAVVFIIYFTVVQYKTNRAALGISFKNFLQNVFYGVVGYIAIVPALILILVIAAAVINITKYVPQRQPVVELFLKEKGAAFITYSSLFAAIVGPIIEELFFRGFMYGALKKYIGIFWAMIASGAVFAALHAHVVGFLSIMALGVLLAYLYEKTGSLVSSVTVHMIHNLSMVFMILLLKQAGVGAL